MNNFGSGRGVEHAGPDPALLRRKCRAFLEKAKAHTEKDLKLFYIRRALTLAQLADEMARDGKR